MTRGRVILATGRSGLAPVLVVLALLMPVTGRANGGDPSAPASPAQVDAEIVQDDFDVQDDVNALGFHRVLREHRVVRVWTEEGAKQQGIGSIPYSNRTHLDDVAFLITTPDGRRSELKPTETFDRRLLRLGKYELKERTFTLPAIVPGSTIEYVIHETTRDPSSLVPLWLTCQRDLPIRSLRITLRPWVERRLALRTNAPDSVASRATMDGQGRLHLLMHDVPAFRREPLMPSEAECRITAFGVYGDADKFASSQWLLSVGNGFHSVFDQIRAHSDSAKVIAQRETAGCTGADQQIRKLYGWCWRSIRNVESGPDSARIQLAPGIPAERTVQAALESRAGTAQTVDVVFAALAAAAGLDVHFGLVVSPEHAAFDTTLVTAGGFTDLVVMVKGDHGWWYCTPGDWVQPCGVIDPRLEGAPAVYTGGGRVTMGHMVAADPESSRIERRGDFTLTSEGGLEGTVEIVRTGHVAAEWRERMRALTDAQRAAEVSRELRELHAAAETDSVRIDGVDDPIRPVAIRFHLRLPDYAQPAGVNLIVPTSPFAGPLLPQLSPADRVHPVVLPFAWVESDEAVIHVPDGASVPAVAVDREIDLAGYGTESVHARSSASDRSIDMRRRVVFGAGHRRRIPTESCGAFREALDQAVDASRSEVAVSLRRESAR